MHAFHRLGVDALGGLALERGKVAVPEHVLDRADAVRPLGMAGRRVVAEARFVGVQKRGHNLSLSAIRLREEQGPRLEPARVFGRNGPGRRLFLEMPRFACG